MKQKGQHLKAWFLRRKSFVLFLAALLFVGGVGVALVLMLHSYSVPVNITITINKKKVVAPASIYSPLTGMIVADDATAKRPVTAIMIENSPDARPQSGLKQAGVVFETIAEGGITRFVALYQEAQPGLIGPVRSVRPYYVEWAAGFDPSMAHVGGSAKALTMIRSGNYGVDIDQFFNGGSYWRATDRYAPHNVYTNFTKLNALNITKNHTTSAFTSFIRKDDPTVKTKPVTNASSIDIPVSSGYYTVHYDYDVTSNSYLRSEGGAPHMDREEGRIQPKVVIALKVPIVNGFEDGYREQINTIGSGKAEIFQDGSVQEVSWSKADAKSQLIFTGADGKLVSLNRGQTWITALDPSKVVSWQ
jgi:hypothetical protein